MSTLWEQDGKVNKNSGDANSSRQTAEKSSPAMVASAVATGDLMEPGGTLAGWRLQPTAHYLVITPTKEMKTNEDEMWNVAATDRFLNNNISRMLSKLETIAITLFLFSSPSILFKVFGMTKVQTFQVLWRVFWIHQEYGTFPRLIMIPKL